MLPIEDVVEAIGVSSTRPSPRVAVIHRCVHAMFRMQTPVWAWSRQQWVEILRHTDPDNRTHCMAVAYLVGGYRDLHFEFPKTNRYRFASRLLGSQALDDSFARLQAVLTGWGYAAASHAYVREALCDMALTTGSAQLEEIAARFDVADIARESGPRVARAGRLVLRVFGSLGLRDSTSTQADDGGWVKGRATAADVLPEWARWIRRWFDTSMLSRRTREEYLGALMKAGRWMTVHHPEAASPSAWTRSLAAEYVAAVDRMTLGEWSHMPHTRRYIDGVGLPLDPSTKAAHLGAMRAFFRDAQEWGWIDGRFDAGRVFRTPRATRALIGPEPRVITDDVWAKLLWAGLNLTPADLPSHGWSGRASWYPFDLVQAIAVTWLFAGLRMNEIVRLRVGCVRWQADPGAMVEDGSQPSAGAVCLLDVPVTKTGTAFTKPVDRLVGEAIGRWEAVRSAHLPLVDHKTGERVDLLFAYRGHRLGSGYVNHILIPLLSAKANVPTADARGRITSHRARSTIATQLYNAKDPMTLFELQAWLGHRSPASTQYYAKITPMTLAKAYNDAGYFARNVRAIEVLVDRDAVQSGAAASGTPWQHFDLGHGYCTYNFFEQCPHRMACARCAFYVPKESTQAQLLEAKDNLQRMLVQIPLTDDERAAVEEGDSAVQHLLERLADIPTPPGPTPREIGLTLLPMVPRHTP
ncbi:tyrosine-type recombinase/integrase [Candidatus Aeolococcus gillhamiae]